MGILAGKISGRAKEIVGRVTNNSRLETKGKIQRGVAEMQQRSKDLFDR